MTFCLCSVHWLAVQMKSTLVLLAAMLASASAFAPAAVGMPKAPALRSTKPATSALKMGEFEVTDGTPYKLSVAPVGAFGFAGWVSCFLFGWAAIFGLALSNAATK